MMKLNSLLVAFCLWQFQATTHAQKLAVDHLWIHVSPGAPEAKALMEAGLKIQEFDQATSIAPIDPSDPRVVKHVGNGTASMVIRFRNIYLELLWVEDREILRQAAPGHSLLNDDSKASPFGIGLRQVDKEAKGLPFESSSRWEPWMRPLVSIATAESDAPEDPTIFVIPDYMRWDVRTEQDPKLLTWAEHQLDIEEVTRIRVHGPGLPSTSQAVQVLAEQKVLEFENSDNQLLEIEFDNQSKSTVDLRPNLPLLIHY